MQLIETKQIVSCMRFVACDLNLMSQHCKQIQPFWTGLDPRKLTMTVPFLCHCENKRIFKRLDYTKMYWRARAHFLPDNLAYCLILIYHCLLKSVCNIHHSMLGRTARVFLFLPSGLCDRNVACHRIVLQYTRLFCEGYE